MGYDFRYKGICPKCGSTNIVQLMVLGDKKRLKCIECGSFFTEDEMIHDVTGDKEAELQASVESEAHFTIKSDKEAIKTMYNILLMMQRGMQVDEYTKLRIGLQMYYLNKYVEGDNE